MSCSSLSAPSTWSAAIISRHPQVDLGEVVETGWCCRSSAVLPQPGWPPDGACCCLAGLYHGVTCFALDACHQGLELVARCVPSAALAVPSSPGNSSGKPQPYRPWQAVPASGRSSVHTEQVDAHAAGIECTSCFLAFLLDQYPGLFVIDVLVGFVSPGRRFRGWPC